MREIVEAIKPVAEAAALAAGAALGPWSEPRRVGQGFTAEWVTEATCLRTGTLIRIVVGQSLAEVQGLEKLPPWLRVEHQVH